MGAVDRERVDCKQRRERREGMKLQDKILARIHRDSSCTTELLLVSDFRLKEVTIRRHVRALMRAGLVERAPDGIALESSAEGRRYLLLLAPLVKRG